MKDLILPVNRGYFKQIANGEKTEEYRLVNDYWRSRLYLKEYRSVIITLGYPRRDDASRRIVFPWRGYETKTITHKHFGITSVKVFAIKLEATP